MSQNLKLNLSDNLLLLQNGVQPLEDSSTEGVENPTVEKQSFCFYDDKYKITASRTADYLTRCGFRRISEDNNDAVTIIQNENKIMKPFNHKTETIAFLKSHINHPKMRGQIENALIKEENNIMKSWKLLDPEPYNLQKDDSKTVYLPFKNGVCKITAKGVEMVDYSDDDISYFAEAKCQANNFQLFDIRERLIGDYEKFFQYAIIGNDSNTLNQVEKNTLKAFYTMVGYMVSNYKNPSNTPAIVLSDVDAVNGKRKGGRGKTLITKMLQQMRPTNSRNGLEFDGGYRHVLGDLKPYEDIYIIDDVPMGFNYDDLYTNITGDIKPETKGSHSTTIPFEYTPKFIITTNYILPFDKDAASSIRRFAEYQFTDFWSIVNRPNEYFGGNFFESWNEKEWQRFYEFVVVCVMEFLQNGLLRVEYSKEADNFRHVFQNDAVLEEFELVFPKMEARGNFSVSDFLNEYKTMSTIGEKIFTTRNTKDYINTYIEYKQLNVKYLLSKRRWYFEE